MSVWRALIEFFPFFLCLSNESISAIYKNEHIYDLVLVGVLEMYIFVLILVLLLQVLDFWINILIHHICNSDTIPAITRTKQTVCM